MDVGDFPCPCCGFLTFGEAPGSYEICVICGWEDDPVQLTHPMMGGGANKESLSVCQAALLKRFPFGVADFNGIARARDWRPLVAADLIQPGVPKNGTEYFEAAAQDEFIYYWSRRDAL